MTKRVSASPSRRSLLQTGLAGAGAAAVLPVAARADDYVTPSMLTPGRPFTGYGAPATYEAGVKRLLAQPGISPGTGSSRTPLEMLEGIITPSGLHYERHHNGVPDIDPATHRLLIHGLVQKPLEFSMDALMRYPRVSRIHFLECGGNSGANSAAEPRPLTAAGIHGLLSCSEWTGVMLGPLLDEAGLKPDGKWLIAESADAAGMSRSIPLAEARARGILALYQNGERLRPEQGYPVRLLMPGWEGNLWVKWLRRIEVGDMPWQAREETSKYTDLLADGRSRKHTFVMDAKSVVTTPSPQAPLRHKGRNVLGGFAWSGRGTVKRVDVSMDGGRNWRTARIDGPVLDKSLVRFYVDFDWNGEELMIQSRAMDSTGYVQPTKDELRKVRGVNSIYHNNGIQTWLVRANGETENVEIG